MHLVLDGYGADAHKLQDEALVHDLLDQYPDAIGMTKISEPFVYRYTTGQVPQDWGVSGFVLIAESHISIHTFPERGYLNVDIFSCKAFDTDAAIRELTGRFGIDSVKTQVLDRGLEEFPDKQEQQPQAVPQPTGVSAAAEGP
jgi:S-adenosylmethionine decarboxylase